MFEKYPVACGVLLLLLIVGVAWHSMHMPPEPHTVWPTGYHHSEVTQ